MMYTIVLLIYLQSGLGVNLAGSTVTGEFTTEARCNKEAVRKRGSLPIPRGYDAAWQDAICVPINRGVRVGNDGATAFERLLQSALQPGACKAEGACRRAGIAEPSPPKPVAPERHRPD
jgi:hypothetical protein